MHIHAAFYINGQRHRKAWCFWKYTRDIWEKVTEGEGYAHHCEPKPCYQVHGERVINYSEKKSHSDMKCILSYLGKDSQRAERRIYQISNIPSARQIGLK